MRSSGRDAGRGRRASPGSTWTRGRSRPFRRWPRWPAAVVGGGTERPDSGRRAPRPAGAPRDHARGGVDRDERTGRNALQLVQQLVGPSLVHGPLEVPVGAVVREDKAVVLHRLQHHPGGGPEPRQVVRTLEPEPGTHRRAARGADTPVVAGGAPPAGW